LKVVFNPVVTPLTEKTIVHYEGCLSLPDLRGEVTRFSKVRLQGFDREGNPIDESVSGFPAAVVQHECDHLDGILYVDRAHEREDAVLPEGVPARAGL
jgi:peptide deformylase